MQVSLRQDLWGDDRPLTLELPEEWDTEVLRMGGDGKPALTAEEYRSALAPLEGLARGRREVCILFDDTSRPTRASLIVPHLLEVLEKAGVRDHQIRFLCALGTHAPLDNTAFRKKLGEEVLTRFPVYNHNPYENCEQVGVTSRGTPVLVNREFLSCDLRIGISSFIPHSFCGFGGGYKLVMPGVAHIDAIAHHHGKLLQECLDTCFGIGRFRENPLLADVKEWGGIAGLSATVSVLVNSRAEPVDIYAGDPAGLYETMIPRALAHYGTTAKEKADIVFVNAYGKANEAVIALSLAELFLKDEGGYVVVLCDIPSGQVVHYLLGRFGKESWGRLAFGERKMDRRVRKIYFYSRFPDRANLWWFGPDSDVHRSGDLEGIVSILREAYRGKTTRVHVIPDGTIQMPLPR